MAVLCEILGVLVMGVFDLLAPIVSEVLHGLWRRSRWLTLLLLLLVLAALLYASSTSPSPESTACEELMRAFDLRLDTFAATCSMTSR